MKPDDIDTKPIRKSMTQRRDEDAAMFRVPEPAPARPPIERYVRCSVTVFGSKNRAIGSIEAGLLVTPSQDHRALREELRHVLDDACVACRDREDADELTQLCESMIAGRWPAHAWFVEVWNEDEALTQVYAPYGMPRR